MQIWNVLTSLECTYPALRLPLGFRSHEDTRAVPPRHLASSAGPETRQRPTAARQHASPRLPRPATYSLQQQHGRLCHGGHRRTRRGAATSARHGGRALSRPSHHHHPPPVKRRRGFRDDGSRWRVGRLWFRHARLQAVVQQALHQGGVHGKWCALSLTMISRLFLLVALQEPTHLLVIIILYFKQ